MNRLGPSNGFTSWYKLGFYDLRSHPPALLTNVTNVYRPAKNNKSRNTIAAGVSLPRLYNLLMEILIEQSVRWPSH